MRKILGALICIGMVACGGTEEISQDGPKECQDRTGMYVVTHWEREGNCGKVYEQIVGIDESFEQLTASQCSGGTRQTSVNRCTVMLSNLVCKNGDLLTVVTGKVDWSESGRTGTGTVQYTISLGDEGCSSTYDVLYEKL